MKILSFAIILGTLVSSTYAQDVIQCDLKIIDNQVKCPLIGFCPEKVLKTSSLEMTKEIHDGGLEKDEIKLSEVIIAPGTSREKKSHVILFRDDNRVEKLKEDKDADIVSLDASYGINYEIGKYGDHVKIVFKTPVYRYITDLRGHSSQHRAIVPISHGLNMAFDCKKITKSIFDEQSRREKVIEDHKKEREKKVQEKRNFEVTAG